MQSDSASRHSLECNVAKSSLPHALGEKLRARKCTHRLRQVLIRIPRSAIRPPDRRQDASRIEVVEAGERAVRRLREFEYRRHSTRTQHAPQLFEPLLVVREIPETECDRDQV